MSQTTDFTTEQQDAIRKIEKLLRLAGKTTSEGEAASAAAKAQELLLAYNLSEAALTGDSDKGVRKEDKLNGGFYEFERDLWSAVAQLNFCMHWCQRSWVKRDQASMNTARVQSYQDPWRRTHQLTWQHHLIGRSHNIAATIGMAQYLLQAADRLCREFVTPDLDRTAEDRIVGLAGALRSRRATSFREGVLERVGEKLWARRQEQLTEERQRQQEDERRAREAGMASAGSASTAVTISSLRQSERDANTDHYMEAQGCGPNWTARQAAERAERAEKARQAEAEYTRWAAANPEEARAQEAEQEKERRKAEKRRRSGGLGSRGGTSHEKERDWTAYRAGHEAGASVGIDPQMRQAEGQRRLGR